MKKKKTSIPANIRILAERLQKLHEEARRLGIFCNDRELFSCQHCELLEGVTFEGRLFVYSKGNENIDTGLRFPEPDKNGVSKCPGCGKKVKVKIL